MARKKSTKQAPNEEAFLRSINIQLDADDASRIEHYVPTSKSVHLIRSLMGLEGDRSFIAVAPYGSGKSLTAAYVLHLIENRKPSRPALRTIGKRLDRTSRGLAQQANGRVTSKNKGLALALQGHCASLPHAIKDAATNAFRRAKPGRGATPISRQSCDTSDELIDFLRQLQSKAVDGGFDTVSILWDEFGKHLEGLALEGKASQLADIQTIAEFTSRSSKPTMTFGLFLHQGLLHYSGNLSQTARNEWIKIEGRFKTIEFVDDSKEIYDLIGQVVAARSGRPKAPPRTVTKKAAKAALKLGLFQGYSTTALDTLVRSAWPLSVATLSLLPRISARIAQNERTLFNFIYSQPMIHECHPWDLYDYFAPQMRSDVTIGGTHRQWLETESAISKVDGNEMAVRILKTTCLLGMGLTGEKSRTSMRLLEFACAGVGNARAWKSKISELIKRNLLLYRKHNDEVTIWHGTDLDIRGRLEDEKSRRRPEFDLIRFLRKEIEPTTWRPHEHNAEFRIRRYFSAEFHSLTSLTKRIDKLSRESLSKDLDGLIIYVPPRTKSELTKIKRLLAEAKIGRVVFATSREPLPLEDAALEVICLQALQLDPELVSSDPLALDELRQMTDDAFSHLQKLLDRLVIPSQQGAVWYIDGKQREISTRKELRSELSQVMNEAYDLTPKLNNEMIVRRKPSTVVINARKKLVLGILERLGEENLGLEGNFPDASMFRTILLHTGLYRKTGGRWGYAKPTDSKLKNQPGLRAVWKTLQDFFTTPDTKPKRFDVLIDKLQAPPIGLRDGVMPILIASAMKAFSSNVNLRMDKVYIADIVPSIVEVLCKEPQRFDLQVLHLEGQDQKHLMQIYKAFSANGVKVPDGDLLRACMDTIDDWKRTLPAAARTSRSLTPDVARFRDLIFQSIDPAVFLLKAIPELATGRKGRDKVKRMLESYMRALVSVTQSYENQATLTLKRVLGSEAEARSTSLTSLANSWASCFSELFVEGLVDRVARNMIRIMRNSGKSDRQLLDGIASLIIGKPLSQWDDNTILRFDRDLQNVIFRVEEEALGTRDSLIEGGAADGLADLACRKIAAMYERLCDLLGEDRAKEELRKLTTSEPMEASK